MGKVAKAIGSAVKSATKTVSGVVSNVAKSATGMAKSALKGNLYGVVKNAEGVFSYGTVNLTGEGGGLVKINADKYMGGKMKSSTSAPIELETSKQKGLVSQLRIGKGKGGGSYTETAKNPLGGTSGKTGK